MAIGMFDKALMEYSDEFLLKAYQELEYMSENGCMPPGQMYFRELVDLRAKLYKSNRDNDTTKKDLFNEIARRWAKDKEI